jgi:MiaB-like tRNA modifying enzyme
LKTFGCSSNRAETAALEGLLGDGGFEVVYEAASAEAVVINTCTVRRDTELRVMKYIFSLSGKMIVVTGCMAEAQPATIAAAFPQASIVSPHNLPMVAKALAAGQRSVFLGHASTPLGPAPYGKGVRHVVTISRGCLGECTYCIVRVAKGRLASVSPDKIVSSISLAVGKGAREVLISAQDTGVYGNDIGTDLPALLHSMTRLTGDFRVRLGMFNPSSVAPFLQRLIEAYDAEKLYKFAHVPVQSGSNSVLRGMGRQYGVDDFRRVITSLRSRHPEMTLFTDIMVGFPGESEDDFKATCLLLEEIKPDKTHIARFSPRPRTPASQMRQLPEDVRKKRSAILTEISRRVQLGINSQWIGRVVNATVVDSFAKGGMIARTDEYKTVAIKGLEISRMGKRVETIICSATPFFLIGEISHR